MTKRFLQAQYFQQVFLKTFFFFAMIAAVCVALPEISQIGINDFVNSYPLTSWLVAYNFLSFIYISRAIKILPFSKYYPVVLYGQTLLYLGVAYEFQDQAAAYLGLLPALTGIISLSKLWTFGEKDGEHRYQTYLYLLVITFGWFQYSSYSFIDATKANTTHYFLPIFFGQTLGMTLFPTLVLNKNEQSMSFALFFRRMLRDTKMTNEPSKQDEKDRFFFHDMINHLYGLTLKLTYRLSKGRGIESQEVGDMLGEVMALQSLMSDHFGYKHKNINQSFDMISFQDLKPFFNAQMNSFLGEECQIDIIYSGIFDEEFESPFEDPQIHFASIYRIFTNLLKNATEANAKRVEVIFNGNHHRLSVTMKNDFQQVSGGDYDLGEGLSRAIQGDRDMLVDYQGLGLAAIESLSAQRGGHFHFEIKDGLWVSYFDMEYGADITDELEYDRWLNSKHLKIQGQKAA